MAYVEFVTEVHGMGFIMDEVTYPDGRNHTTNCTWHFDAL